MSRFHTLVLLWLLGGLACTTEFIDHEAVDGRMPAAGRCGDERLQEPELCDDGNTVSGDGCSQLCLLEICGDSIQDAAEECDDGNLASGDGCSQSCLLESCGNHRLDIGEECDDGNAGEGDGCDPGCRVVQPLAPR